MIDDEKKSRRPLLAFLLVTLAVGALGSVVTTPAIPGWYAGLNHPAIAPPNWVFAPVWTTLYVMMAVAAWRAWKVAGTRSVAINLYGIQLALNLLWSMFFFGLHRMDWAFAEIILLILSIAATTIFFWRACRIAGLLMLPYLAWTIFAANLNWAFLQLNT